MRRGNTIKWAVSLLLVSCVWQAQPIAAKRSLLQTPTPTTAPTTNPTTAPITTPAPTTNPTTTPTPGTPVPTDTGVPTPTGTPTGTPTDTPTGSPTDTPAATPASSPAESPANSPANSPADSPAGTPEGSVPGLAPSPGPAASPELSPPADAPSNAATPPSPEAPAGRADSGSPGLLPLPITGEQGSHTGALDSGTGLPSSGSASLLPSVTELDILNYMVALQCLSVNFYSCAATGHPATDTAAPAGCKQAQLPTWLRDYAATVATEGVGQAKLLKEVVQLNGGQAVCPVQNIDGAFDQLVRGAFNGSSPLPNGFDVMQNEYTFLAGAFVLDHLTAAASLGAAAVSNPQVNREVLTLIAAAKEEHVGIIRARTNDRLSDKFEPTNLIFEQFITAISNYINRLVGGTLIHPLFNSQGQQIANVGASGAPSYFLTNVDSHGVPPRALPAGIRSAFTLGAATGQGGGFFPNGA